MSRKTRNPNFSPNPDPVPEDFLTRGNTYVYKKLFMKNDFGLLESIVFLKIGS